MSKGNSNLLIFILALGVFGIINTEMGVIGIIPLISKLFNVSIQEAGWTVSFFAFTVAICAPITPLLFSKFNRKKIMLVSLGVFIISNIISMFTTNFIILLIARVLPAIFHPVYVTMAFTTAASLVAVSEAPKAISKIFIGVSAGMVLGVPFTNFIANEISFSVAMLFFALINIVVFVATIFIVPEIPIQNSVSYKKEIEVLKIPPLWYSIGAVVFINGGIFGFFSYFSDFLEKITRLEFGVISILLLVYGFANILGNVLAGRLLFKNPKGTILFIPIIVVGVFISLFILGDSLIEVSVITFVLGVLAGIASNAGQYMISTSVTKASDFINGLFLTSANLGTAVGTIVCGIFISYLDTRYSIYGAILFLLIGISFVLLRKWSLRAKEAI